jgi:hypothetical protein
MIAEGYEFFKEDVLCHLYKGLKNGLKSGL